MNNLLWVTQDAGPPTVNYCGNPATGKPIAALALPSPSTGGPTLLTVSPTHMDYLSNGAGGARERLRWRRINSHC